MINLGSDIRIDEMVNGHQYIDLGLASGTLWAFCNLGADSPEDVGDFFSWGDEKGYEAGKRDFVAENCSWFYKSGTVYHFCTNPSEGDVDNKIELDCPNDTAQILWGGNWRMPSICQMRELIKGTVPQILTDKGGCLFVSKSNGNSLFLPFGGHMRGSHYPPRNFSNCGLYWSRSLDKANNICAHYLDISPDKQDETSVSIDCIARYCGLSIRPVVSVTEKRSL